MSRSSTVAHRLLGSSCDSVREATPDDQVDGVPARLVAFPKTAHEVAETMAAAAALDLAVVVRGGGTKLAWGRPPQRLDLLLDLGGMSKVLDHAANDLVLHVQAGARLTDVQAALSPARQRLAVDETAPRASVGGALATATSGPARLGAGAVRDLLLGASFVLPDGRTARTGGRVVKNVAGYDLGRLLTGSFGTLAVITDAIFRLHPFPAARTYVSWAAHDPAAVGRDVRLVLDSPLAPSALELDRGPNGLGTLCARLEGSPDGVAVRSAALTALVGRDAELTAEAPPGWGRLPVAAGSPAAEPDVTLKITFARSGLADVVLAADRGPVVTLRGAAAAGVLYAAIPGTTSPATLVAFLSRLRATCARHGGAVQVLDGPAELKDAVDIWGPVPAIDLMRRVKAAWDPSGRLAPGRFVGGI